MSESKAASGRAAKSAPGSGGDFRWPLVRGLGVVAAMAVPASSHGEWDSEKYLIHNLGPVSLRPQLEVAETYDSNLYYAEEDVVDDFVLSVKPGLLLTYGQRDSNWISIGYTLDASIYADQDGLNNFGHLVSHQSVLKTSRWTIRGTDNLTITKTLLGGSFSYIRQRIGLVSLSDQWRADYELSPRLLVGGKFGFDLADYDESDLQNNHLYDYTGYSVGARVGYMPSEKIVVYPEVTFGQSFLGRNNPLAPEAPDVDTYSFAFGAEGEFTPKLTGTVSGGYEIRDYSDDSEIPNGWVADFNLRWQARPKTAVSVGYRHFIQISREARAIPYSAHRPTVSLVQQFGTQSRLSAALDAYYQFNDYEGEFRDGGSPPRLVGREDEFIGTGLWINWRWHAWLTAKAGYEFRRYTDNLNSIPNYDLHRISLRLVAGY